jgi:hypothetical protein
VLTVLVNDSVAMISDRRAFTKLRDKFLQAKEDLSELKRATYAVVRGEPAPVSDHAAVLGTDGPLRVSTISASLPRVEPSCCLVCMTGPPRP